MKHLGGGLAPTWDELLNSSEGEGEENAANDKPTEPLAKKRKSDDLKALS